MLASYDCDLHTPGVDEYTLNLLGAFAVGCVDLQDAAMGQLGLPPAELAALLAVHARPGSTIGDLAHATGLTHSGAVRVIDRLDRAGWVERQSGPDRRTVAVRCTGQGRRRAKRALSLRRTMLQDATKDFSRSDDAAFRRLAQKFLSCLPRERPDAWRICRWCDHGVCCGADCPVGSVVP